MYYNSFRRHRFLGNVYPKDLFLPNLSQTSLITTVTWENNQNLTMTNLVKITMGKEFITFT